MLCDRRSPRVFHQDRMVQLREPTLREALADPIVQAMMQADGVDSRELEAMLMRVVQSSARPRARGHTGNRREPEQMGLDSRFRGNERTAMESSR
jgi:hypothetical protein